MYVKDLNDLLKKLNNYYLMTNNKIIKDLDIEVHNLQAIEYFKGTFTPPACIIEGDNGKGKSTVLQLLGQSFGADIDSPTVRDGAKSGDVVITIRTIDGKQWIYGYNTNATGKEHYYLLQDGETMIEGKKNVLSTLTSIFGYKWFTLNEFMNMCKTAEGKRKLTELLIKAMPKAVQDKYNANIALSNTKDGTAYVERTRVNKELDIAKATYDAIVIPDVTEDRSKLVADINTANLLIQQLNDEIIKRESKIDELKKQIAVLGQEIVDIEVDIRTQDTIVSNINTKLAVIDSKTQDIQRKDTASKEIVRLNNLSAELSASIELARTENKELLKNNCPVDGLVFTDDDILVNDRSIDKLATSERTMVYSKVSYASNNIPVIFFDQIDGINKVQIDAYIKLAIENKCILIMTRMKENEPLSIQQINFDVKC